LVQRQAGSAAAAAAALLGPQHWQQQHRALSQQASNSDGSAAEPAAQAADKHRHSLSDTALPSSGSPESNTLHKQHSTEAAPDPAHQSAASSALINNEASQPLAQAASGRLPLNSSNLSSSSGGASSNGLAQASYERLARLSSAINRLTGYESIDKLKGSVGSANQQLQDVKGALAAAKAEYDECLARQTQLHR
jgi:hypothetical protein